MAQTRRKAGPAESGPRVFRQAEQMQACAFLFVPFGAGAHTALPRELHFSIFILQLRAAFEASFLFLASQNRETKQREICRPFAPEKSDRSLPSAQLAG